MKRCLWRRFVLACACVFALQAGSAHSARACERNAATLVAVQEPPTVNPPSTRSTEPATNPPVTENRNETERFTLSHERYEKAVAYSRMGYALYFVSVFSTLIVLLLVLRFGIAAKFRDWAERTTENRFLQAAIFVPLLVATIDLLDLPVSAYWHSLSLRYQQSVQPWGSWFLDWLKSELIFVCVGIVLAYLLFLVIRVSPRRWWFYFWIVSLPILLFLNYVGPKVIAPMFNKFEPLGKSHPELVATIQKVSYRAGLSIPADRMFLMIASEKTNQINAYVSGLGSSKRVVVWDTTINKTTPEETLFIFGHEAGHYVLGHIRDQILFLAGMFLIGLYLGFRSLHWVLGKWGAVWKVYGPQDWASLAIMLFLLQLFIFLSSPVTASFGRYQEHEADIFGLEVIHGIVPNSSEVAAHAFQVLGEQDLADPNPPAFVTFWLYSHPPLADRLVFAHTYDPWSRKEPTKYVK